MSIITWTRSAKCKDCAFLKANYDKKRKRHFCSNEKSKQFAKQITLNDLVCDVWVI